MEDTTSKSIESAINALWEAREAIHKAAISLNTFDCPEFDELMKLRRTIDRVYEKTRIAKLNHKR